MKDGCMIIWEGKDDKYHCNFCELQEQVPSLYQKMADGFSGLGNKLEGGCSHIPAGKVQDAVKEGEIAVKKKNKGYDVDFKRELSDYGFKKPEEDYELFDFPGR